MGHRRFLPPDHEFRFDAKSFDGSEEHRAVPIAYAQTAILDKIKSVKDFEKSKTWKEVSAKVLYIEDLEKLEERIIMTLCRMEMIFPPGFFTVMVHLVIHLATEAKIGGPVCYRSMWFTERYLGKLKSNVRNKAHPEGSIAEAYLADECMTFCSRYIVGFETKHNLTSRNEDSEELVGHCDVTRRSTLFPHAGNPLGKPGNFVLRGLDKVQAHRYLLFNCSDVNSYLRAHADEIKHRRNVNLDTIERTQNEKFHEWFRAHIKNLEEENGINSIKNDIRWLARGPVHAARRYRNANPVLRDVTYYGRIIDIIEMNYSGQFSVVLFKCEWVDVFSEEGIQKDKI
ncbi:uncharacterized protein LOC124695951 [Lolium rigidum]|uniref:uncharacterized protein LOC124695951 n=1 Tax=Lolium rigidum TaxID=89674 RepID=UPI001F5C34DE|nr:uncharacterized protein LOC124695951 [Lolium rigidum]